MNDIDFDELDRAVSSLIGKPNPDAPTPDTANQARPAASASQLSPSSNMPQPMAPAMPKPRPPISSLPASPTGAPASPPAARRAGRFMDVVHPSRVTASTPSAASAPSTPKVKPATVPQPTRISYTGKKLEPVSGVSKPHLGLSPKPAQMPEIDEDEPLLTAEALSHPEVKAGDKAEKSTDLSPPLFLSGTKVEKRPLGKFSTATKDPDDDKQTSVDEIPKKGTADLPPELDNKVVAVEAGDIEAAEEKERPDTPPAYPPEPESGRLREEGNVKKQPVLRPQAATPSIPAQYRAKHPETDMTPRPIFDTKDYHQPLARPTKKPAHKPWVWIMVALALLAVGAAIGVGAYFMLG